MLARRYSHILDPAFTACVCYVNRDIRGKLRGRLRMCRHDPQHATRRLSAASASNSGRRSIGKRVDLDRDLEISQFWQNLQVRLQPAVPNDMTGVPGKK